jgi:hypothetical protein
MDFGGWRQARGPWFGLIVLPGRKIGKGEGEMKLGGFRIQRFMSFKRKGEVIRDLDQTFRLMKGTSK